MDHDQKDTLEIHKMDHDNLDHKHNQYVLMNPMVYHKHDQHILQVIFQANKYHDHCNYLSILYVNKQFLHNQENIHIHQFDGYIYLYSNTQHMDEHY